MFLRGGRAQSDAMLARALQNPELMAEILSRYGRSSSPSAALAVADAIRAGGHAGMSH
jgi:hypothetical protein